MAKIIEKGLRPLILGMEATDVVGVWERIYRYQLVGYGMGARWFAARRIPEEFGTRSKVAVEGGDRPIEVRLKTYTLPPKKDAKLS